MYTSSLFPAADMLLTPIRGQRQPRRPQDLRSRNRHRQIRRRNLAHRDHPLPRQSVLPRAGDHPGHAIRLRRRHVVRRRHAVRAVHGQDPVHGRQQQPDAQEHHGDPREADAEAV